MKKMLFLMGFVFFALTSVTGQSIYTWNQTGTESWAVAANWTPTRTTPLTNDVLLFNNAANTTVTNMPTETIGQLFISNSTTVNLQPAAGGNTLTIAGGAGVDFTIATGSALNLNSASVTNFTLATGTTGLVTGNITVLAAAHLFTITNAGGLVFNSPAIFTQETGFTGEVFGTSTTPQNVVVFNSGTSFIQKAGSNPFGLSQPASKVVFNTGSLYVFQNASGAPSLAGRTYGDFHYNVAATSTNTLGGAGFTIDNYTISLGTHNINNPVAHNIKGNISVAAGATLNFNPATSGALNFNGTAVQNINNLGTLSFASNFTFNINNSNGLVLNAPINLPGILSLTNGTISTTASNLLTMAAGSSVTGGSNASFVNGPLKKVGNTPFVFPVGKLNCGPSGTVKGMAAIEIANLIPPGALTDQYTAEYIRGDALSLGVITAPGLAPPGHISRCDYWTLVRNVGASTVDITLYWDEAINNCISTAVYINDISSLTVTQNDNGVGATWATMGSVGGFSTGLGTGYVPWTGVQSANFGAFAIASTNFNNPLPIDVNYFTGNKQLNKHILNWKLTCNSSPTVHIDLERSVDGRNYSSIYSEFATAVRCQQPFDFKDEQPVAGINYYRLKMRDAAGKISYSTIVSLINATKGIDVQPIAPNPIVSGRFTLNISAAKKAQVEMLITDMQGRLLQQRLLNLVAGFNTLPVNVMGLSKGTYQIVLNTNEAYTKLLRFVIQ